MKVPSLRLIHKGLILVGVPLILAFLVVLMIFGLIIKTDKAIQQEIEARQVVAHSTRSMLLLYDVGYTLQQRAVSADPHLFKRVRGDLEQIVAEQAALSKLSPYMIDRRAMNDIDKLFFNTLQDFRSFAHSLRANLFSLETVSRLTAARNNFACNGNAVCQALERMVLPELQDLEKSPERQKSLFRFQTIVLSSSAAASVLLGLLLARLFMSSIAARLQVITDNTHRLSRAEPLNRPLDGSDEIAALDGAFHSMAEALKQAMSKERALFESASDIICLFDEQMRFTAVNPALSRTLGFAAEDLMGTELIDIVHEDDLDRTLASIAQTRTAQPSAAFENRVRRKDGVYIDLLWSVYWSEIDGALYAVAHDISDRKQIERMKEDFLGMVSHDLRSPLVSIFGTFKLIAAGAFGQLPEAAQQKVQGTITNVNRLLALVNDLLDMEKLAAGQLELAVDKTPIPELLERAVSEMEAVAQAKQIQLKIECDAQEFPVDADRLMQVLVNLLANAIKFSEDGSTVTLKSQSVNDSLLISVSDQGRGVPKEYQEVIFERFKQVDVADGRRAYGTGLGLPICKQIVEQHGGTIQVDSEPGKGSTFLIKIPRQGPAVRADLPKIKSIATSVSSSRLPVATARPERSSRFSFANLPLIYKGAVLVIIPIVFELGFASALYSVLKEGFVEQQQEQYHRLIASEANYLLLLHYDMGTIMSMPQTPGTWEHFDLCAHTADATFAKLEKLTAPDAEYSAAMAELNNILVPGRAFIDQARECINREGVTPKSLIRAFRNRTSLETLGGEATPCVERLVNAHRPDDRQAPELPSRRRLRFVLLLGLLTGLVISVISAILFSSGISKRLRVMQDNARRLENDQELNPMISGNDEVGHLDQVFHAMDMALKEARHKERAVFDNAQDILCALDSQGNVLRINPACERLWGYTPQELKGLPVTQFHGEEDAQRLMDAFQLARLGRESTAAECALKLKDGSQAEMLWSISWSPVEESLIAVVHDISVRKELERLKQEFLAMVSHDMRTPLTSIQTATQMMSMGVIPGIPQAARDQLQVVVRNCDRLIGLINDLLDMDKLESGHIQLIVQAVPAAEILKRTFESLSSLAASRNVEVRIDAPADMVVEADAERLVQVGVNLLSNAIKFSPEGSTVVLKAERASDCIEFRVRDSGRGIPEAQLAMVFERYKQVDANDGLRRSGTGLGLPICKQIVELHNGQIGVDSELGQGSTFWFRIPAVAVISEPRVKENSKLTS